MKTGSIWLKQCCGAVKPPWPQLKRRRLEILAASVSIVALAALILIPIYRKGNELEHHPAAKVAKREAESRGNRVSKVLSVTRFEKSELLETNGWWVRVRIIRTPGTTGMNDLVLVSDNGEVILYSPGQ